MGRAACASSAVRSVHWWGDGRPAAPGAGSDQPAGIADNSGSLVYMLLLAFIGGSILNLMPCVFPVLGLKVMGI